MMMRSLIFVFVFSFPIPAFADTTQNIGGTIIKDGVLDISTLNFETFQALQSMLGVKKENIEGNILKSETGDVFADARENAKVMDRVLGYAEDFKNL